MGYKYLVTNGCSQTQGQNCPRTEIWANKLANKLGLKLINLASPGSGWYKVESSTLSFINNNQDIIDECFFILQKSELNRRPHTEEIPLIRTDRWEDYNIKFLSQVDLAYHGFKDHKKFDANISFYDLEQWGWPVDDKTNGVGLFNDAKDNQRYVQLNFLPEHKHYPNSRNHWKLGPDHTEMPPYIHEQFEEMMLHWGTRISGIHHILKSQNIGHIIVDGYSPFMSHGLKFKNYYDTDDEFEWVKEFWSTNNIDDDDDGMIYDFKNIKSKWIFDSIDIKYKIDDVVLWSLYQFKPHQSEWNIDGGHAGTKGMDLITDVLYKNLIQKGWFSQK